MQARYLALSPYNLVRVILGERFPDDSDQNNVYTRATAYLNQWIADGILEHEPSPSFYAYYQRFTVPDTGETRERKSLIALAALEDYSTGVVFRHEQTLSGPKKDRMELLRHTRALCEQLFLLYEDPELTVDKILDQAAAAEPVLSVTDEDGHLHRMWRISDPAATTRIQQFMADKRLLIADGHHRYETALAYRNENPGLADARNVVMTLVNMYSPGLEILATHRVLSHVAGFDAAALLHKAGARKLSSIDELRQMFGKPDPRQVRIGIALPSGEVHLYARDRKPGELDVKVLHEYLLGEVLGIGEEAVREQKHIDYVRGLDAAYSKVRSGADVAFLLEPTTVQQTADVAFSGGVMPQKSTDFYPKLLSGLTIYKLER